MTSVMLDNQKDLQLGGFNQFSSFQVFIFIEKECQGHILFPSFCEIIPVEVKGIISEMH